MREKPGTHEMARLIIDMSREKLGGERLVYCKRDAMTVLGCSRSRVDQIYKSDKILNAVDLARRICVSD